MTGVHKHDDEYMMYSFKVKPCPRLDHHNWKHCPHRHPGEVAAQRRHPSLHKPAFCMNLKLYGSCAAGDDCPFSHNTFEMSLHPERYKTTLCTLGDKCNREICFFAHSTNDLRTPDVTAPLGALGAKATTTLLSNGDACSTAPAAAAAQPEGLRLLQQQQPQLQPQQSDDLQRLLRQVEHQLQLEPGSQQQQAQLQQQHQAQQQQDQQAMLLAQVQAQQAHQQQQQQQQMNELMLAQQQLLMANAAGNLGSLQQRGGESFTSQCSTASFVSGIGALRAAGLGSLPVSPLIDRSANSFTITDRSNTGSFTTLGVVPQRPHSFSVGDRSQQQAALLASLGERPPSFTLLDASRPNSFSLGQQASGGFAVERSAASYSVLDSSGGLGGGMDGGLSVVERSAQTQRSFTMGQRPTLQQLQQQSSQPWYEADQQALMVQQAQAQLQQEQQQQQGGGRPGLSALWQWR